MMNNMILKAAIAATFVSSSSAFVSGTNKLAFTARPKVIDAKSRSTLSMVAIDTSDIKNGLTVELEGEPWKVLNFSVMKQARGAAKMTIKFKNLLRGNTLENTYRSGEKFQTAMIEKRPATFTYNDEMGNFLFMDNESYEEIMVEKQTLDEKSKWMVEGMNCDIVTFKDKCIDLNLPNPFTYEVSETEPNMKGNTSGAHTKPALLSCGATITIPGYIEQGTMIKVDTDKAKYMEKA